MSIKTGLFGSLAMMILLSGCASTEPASQVAGL